MIKIVKRSHERLRLQQKDPPLWRVAGVIVAIAAGVALANLVSINGQPLMNTKPVVAGLLGFSVAITGAGLWLLLTGGVSLEFNKTKNKMTLHQSDLLSLVRGASTVECNLSDIRDIVLDEAWEEAETDDEGKVTTPAQKIYLIALVLDSGRRIPLLATSGPESTNKAKIVRQVKQFLFYTNYQRKANKAKVSRP